MADIEPRPASSVLTSEDTELVDLEDCLSENEEDIEDALSIVEVCGTLAENAELEVLNYRNSMHLSDNGISEESAVKSLKVTFKLARIVEELAATEKCYCDDLIRINTLREKLCLKYAPHEITLLFGNLQELIHLHESISARLDRTIPKSSPEDARDRDGEKGVDVWRPTRDVLEEVISKIASIFLSVDLLAAYAPYCANHPGQLSALASRTTNAEFQTVLMEWQTQQDIPLPIQAYLLKPVQRILKYPLLFDEIAAAPLVKEHLTTQMQHVCAMLHRVAQDANTIKRQRELQTVMLGDVYVVRGMSLAEKFKGGGYEGDIKKFGALVDEATGLQMQRAGRDTKVHTGSILHRNASSSSVAQTRDSSRRGQRVKSRCMFLFERVLLSCKQYDDKRIAVKHEFNFNSVVVSAKGQRTIAITEFGTTTYLFDGVNADVWVANVNRLAEQHRDYLVLEKSKRTGQGGSSHGVVYRRNRRSRVLSGVSEGNTHSLFASSSIAEESPLPKSTNSLVATASLPLTDGDGANGAHDGTSETAGTTTGTTAALDAATSPTLPPGADLAEESFTTVASERDELRMRNEQLLEAQRRHLEKGPGDQKPVDGSPHVQDIRAMHTSSGCDGADAATEFADMLKIREHDLKQLIWSTTSGSDANMSVLFNKTGKGVRPAGNGTDVDGTEAEPRGVAETLDRHAGLVAFQGSALFMDNTINLEGYFFLKRPTATPACLFNPYSMRGYLVKRGTFRKNWLRRWFVFSLRTKHLAYYRESDENQLRGVIPLTNICATAVADSLRGINPSIMPSGAQVLHIITLDRTYHLLAPDAATLDAWRVVLSLAVKT